MASAERPDLRDRRARSLNAAGEDAVDVTVNA
jgi:hypothetical protein